MPARPGTKKISVYVTLEQYEALQPAKAEAQKRGEKAPSWSAVAQVQFAEVCKQYGIDYPPDENTHGGDRTST